MRYVDSKGCWFAAGMLTGALLAAWCAMRASRVRPGQDALQEGAGEGSIPQGSTVGSATFAASATANAAGVESGAEMFEYRGFVVHLYWQAVGEARYKAWCDIWEAGAIVQEASGPPATYLTAAEARMAAGAWARHWIQNNG